MSTTDLTAPRGSRAIKDPEILALASINRILNKLEPKARRRVLDFIDQRLRGEKDKGQ